MSKHHIQETLQAGNMGTYRPNALFTRISSEGDLEPEYGDPLPGAVALHAHEYTHYLHNLSTNAGAMSLVSSFWLIHPFIKNADRNAQILVSSESAVDDDVISAFKVMNVMRGVTRGIPKGYSWPSARSWDFKQPTLAVHEVTHSSKIVAKVNVFTIKSRAVFSDDHSLDIEIQPGLDFISEGVAYEIEREIRRHAGISDDFLDHQTPSYPYLTFRPLVDFLIGQPSTAEERILLGTFALLDHSPSEGLIKACSVVRMELQEGLEGGFSNYLNQALYHFKKYANGIIESQLPAISKILSQSKTLSTGVEIYCKLIKKSLENRQKSPVMEAVFIQSKMTAEDFLRKSLNILERQVCQEKPGSASVISWIGLKGSIADESDETLQAFSVLQAAVHYVQQHFTINAIVPTADIPETRCPFSRACEIQTKANFPEACDTKPWEFQLTNDRTKVCFYEAARIALASRISSESS
jgi:hypothetical protein